MRSVARKTARCVALAFVGVLVCSSLIAGPVTYEYDDAGRLTKAAFDDGTVINYTLDPAGNRQTVASTLGAGLLQFSAPTFLVAESGGSITITVTRTVSSTGAVSVNYATSNGTATSGSDYTTASGTLNWANGDAANKTFNVTILEDVAVEGSETVNLTLSSPGGGAALGSPATAVLTITDNDVAGPSVPANLRFSPTNNSPNYSVLWDASTGSPTYYELDEDRDVNDYVPPNYTRYTINAPTTSKSFSGKQASSTGIDWWYRVRACNVSTQCSAWTNSIMRTVCTNGVCQ